MTEKEIIYEILREVDLPELKRAELKKVKTLEEAEEILQREGLYEDEPIRY